MSQTMNENIDLMICFTKNMESVVFHPSVLPADFLVWLLHQSESSM